VTRRLHPDDLAAIEQLVGELLGRERDAIAYRAVELLGQHAHHGEPAALKPRSRGLVDASTLAAELGLSRDTIYRRAKVLGGVRVPSGGSRGRWRFDVDAARAALEAAPVEREPVARPPRWRRPSTAPDVELLPIRPVGRRTTA
jgi:hypothetical protein